MIDIKAKNLQDWELKPTYEMWKEQYESNPDNETHKRIFKNTEVEMKKRGFIK